MVQTINELGYKPKMVGGAMVGLQATVFKTAPRPASSTASSITRPGCRPRSQFERAEDFLKKYQSQAGAEGVDPLGYYLGDLGLCVDEVLGQAVEGTKSVDDAKLVDWFQEDHVKTIMGDMRLTAQNGEWTKSGMMQVQYHSVKTATPSTSSRAWHADRVVGRPDQKTGKVVYPYEKAK